MTEANGAGRRTIVVALDSMEIAWLERHIAEGALPNLAAFAGAAQRVAVTSLGAVLHGSLWPSFSTGLNPGKHGIYFWSQWHPETMGYIRNTDARFDFDPFWSDMAAAGKRATIVDIPYVRPVRERGFRTATGWGMHDESIPASYPDDFLPSIVKTYGKHPLSFDVVEPVSAVEKLKMVRDLRRGVHKRAKVLRDLVAQPGWDLLVCVFGETHKAMHYLAADEELRPGVTNQRAIAAMLDPLDRAWPEILEAAGPDCDVILMSLHGITEQVAFDGFGSQLLDLLAGREPADRFEKEDLVRKIRNLMPTAMRQAIWRRVPASVRVSRHGALQTGTGHLTEERAFPVPHDGHPAIRVNVAGRERDGIVPPGQDRRLLDHLEALAREYLTADGQVAFPAMWRAASEPGPRSHWLPDALLLANPNVTRANALIGPEGRRLVSTQPEARNGVHTGSGFAFMRLTGGRMARRDNVDTVDFAPALLDLLRVPSDRRFDGTTFLS